MKVRFLIVDQLERLARVLLGGGRLVLLDRQQGKRLQRTGLTAFEASDAAHRHRLFTQLCGVDQIAFIGQYLRETLQRARQGELLVGLAAETHRLVEPGVRL